MLSMATVVVGLVLTGSAVARPKLDSLTGSVTAAEVASFEAAMATEDPTGRPAGSGNWMADCCNGRNVEALGVMFELTGHVTILDRMIDFVEPILDARNDPKTGQVMWTGKRELVWVTKAAGTFNVGYAGSENGDALGHIAYCARLILETPAIWGKTVPDGDPHHRGATYLERARTYVAEADKTLDTYVLPNFIDPKSHRLTPPTSSAWVAMDENVTAWNRQMMFDNGFQRLAEAHELLGDRPDKVALYDAIVKASVEWFLSEVHLEGAAYVWSYGPGLYPKNIEYNEGIHAAYDLIGVWNAYASCRYGLDAARLRPFAHTVLDLLSLGPGKNQFYSYVDGTGPILKDMRSADWLYLAAFDREVFATVAGANLADGRVTGSLDEFSTTLAVKNAIAKSSFPDCAAKSSDAGADASVDTGDTGDTGTDTSNDAGAQVDASPGNDASKDGSGDVGEDAGPARDAGDADVMNAGGCGFGSGASSSSPNSFAAWTAALFFLFSGCVRRRWHVPR